MPREQTVAAQGSFEKYHFIALLLSVRMVVASGGKEALMLFAQQTDPWRPLSLDVRHFLTAPSWKFL